jgi:hypothetical protein
VCNQYEALGSAFPAARKHDLAGRGEPDRAVRGTGGKACRNQSAPANSAENLPRAAVQVAASIGIAALSWHFVEEPIRRGALGRAWKRLRSRTARQAQPAGVSGWAAVTGGAMVVAPG